MTEPAAGLPPTQDGDARSGLVAIVILVVTMVGLGSISMALQGPVAGASVSASPRPVPTASEGPVASPSFEYAAVFDGDATGETDVTPALTTFLESHDGERVALAVGGVYSVTQLTFTATDLTVDFRGSRLEGALVGAHGILVIRAGSGVTLNGPTIVGTGYEWDEEDQNEHGIHIDGGSDIVINQPITRDTRGDGIYVGFSEGRTEPATGVVINEPDIERASRNGIAPVAGEVSIIGGRIATVGLHGIDFEPNSDEGASSIRGIVSGVDIRGHGDLPGIELASYAIAAGGYSDATKPSMTIQGVTGDHLQMTIRYTAVVAVQDNVSDADATADFPGSGEVTFTGNVRIARE